MRKVNIPPFKGNTPTHVGKTLCTVAYFIVMQKHPHARGEDSTAFCCPVVWAETPPRTWGRLDVTVLRIELVRNTPTHVGKTHDEIFTFPPG